MQNGAFDLISTIISIFALAVSGLTLWITYLSKGRVKAVWPSLIAFGYETSRRTLKLIVRTHLYTTSQRGHVIQSLYATLQQGDRMDTLSTWAYSENPPLQLGSGLYVDSRGTSLYHHFLPVSADEPLRLVAGELNMTLWCQSVLGKKPFPLFQTTLLLTEPLLKGIGDGKHSLMFLWSPNISQYTARLDENSISAPGVLDTLIRYREYAKSQDPLGES